MKIYEIQTAPTTRTGPIMVWTLISASAPASILEVGICLSATSVAGNAVFGIPASNGTGSAGTALQALDPSDAAASTHMLTAAFTTTQPTAPTNPFRQWGWVVSGGTGSGITWGWDVNELMLPTGGQIVLWATVGAATFRGYVKVAEGG